jgi:hypothetical protein
MKINPKPLSAKANLLVYGFFRRNGNEGISNTTDELSMPLDMIALKMRSLQQYEQPGNA